MAKIKENSTIQENKQAALKQCPVTYVMEKDRRLLETHHFVSSFWLAASATARSGESYSGHHRESVDPAPERTGKRRLATAGSQACSTSLCNLSAHRFRPGPETGIGRDDSLGHGFSRLGGHCVSSEGLAGAGEAAPYPIFSFVALFFFAVRVVPSPAQPMSQIPCNSSTLRLANNIPNLFNSWS